MGGGGTKFLELDESEVINKYKEFNSISLTAIYFKCSKHSIKEILKKNDIKIISSKEIVKLQQGKKVLRINPKNNEVLEIFDSLHDVGQWVLDNNFSNAKNRKNCIGVIKNSIIKGSIKYGYKWQFEKDSDLQFNLNNKIKDISKEELVKIIKGKSLIEIQELYNVSESTIKKWCQKYLIPYKREDINKISDKDWEKECNLTKEEYEIKYCQPKEKKVYSDEEIIEYYKEFKSLKAVVIKCHRDRETIKNILINNGIDISRENQKDINFQRLDKDSLEILEIYTYLDDVVNWVHNNINSKVKRTSIQASINKACRNNGNLYGYKWRKIK